MIRVILKKAFHLAHPVTSNVRVERAARGRTSAPQA
jgi:hypothetical protein